MAPAFFQVWRQLCHLFQERWLWGERLQVQLKRKMVAEHVRKVKFCWCWILLFYNEPQKTRLLIFFLKGWFITISHLPLLYYESSWFCHSLSKTEVMTLLYLRRVLIHIKKQSPSSKFTTVVNFGKNTGTICSISNFLSYTLPSINLLFK